MRGAEDAVGEVHDDSPARQTQQLSKDEINNSISSHDTINILTDTTSDVFLGGSIDPATDSSIGHYEPTQNIEEPTFSEVQAKTSEGSTSRRDKRKVMYYETGSVDNAGSSAILRI